MRSSKKSLYVVFGSVLAASLMANGVLAYFLARSRTVDATAVRHKAWKSCHKLSMQHLLFERARERARAEKRKLVVIGNPSGGWVNKVVRTYGCGDVCIDIAGCAPCGPETRVIKDDAIKALRTLPANSAVVFESEVFEYVNKMEDAVKELDRITGHDYTRVYAVHSISINPWPYHTKGTPPPPPTRAMIKKRRKGRLKYAQTGEGMARRIIYRFPPRDRYTWTEL